MCTVNIKTHYFYYRDPPQRAALNLLLTFIKLPLFIAASQEDHIIIYNAQKRRAFYYSQVYLITPRALLLMVSSL